MKLTLCTSVFLLLSQLGATRAVDQRELSPNPNDDNTSDRQPKYYTLPSLREQAAIQDAWTKERRAGIPKILQKYAVDAWLVCFSTLTSLQHRNHLH